MVSRVVLRRGTSGSRRVRPPSLTQRRVPPIHGAFRLFLRAGSALARAQIRITCIHTHARERAHVDACSRLPLPESPHWHPSCEHRARLWTPSFAPRSRAGGEAHFSRVSVTRVLPVSSPRLTFPTRWPADHESVALWVSERSVLPQRKLFN